MLLDEPTSGLGKKINWFSDMTAYSNDFMYSSLLHTLFSLDASTAFKLMLTLKRLAELGHSIAVVIHQPRTSIFNMFDNLLLLSKGRVVYEGNPNGVRQFLESCPGIGELPAETNRADWICDVIDNDEKKDEGGTLASLWEEYYAKEQQQHHESLSAAPQCNSGTVRQRSKSSVIKTRKVRRMSTLQELETNEPKFQSSFVSIELSCFLLLLLFCSYICTKANTHCFFDSSGYS